MMNLDLTIESLMKRDRVVVLTVLIIITLLAWGYVIQFAGNMGAMPTDSDGMDMGGMTMTMPSPVGEAQIDIWSVGDGLVMFGMWAAMMVGMMTPSAAPVILLYALVFRKRVNPGQPFAPTAAFFIGYLTLWISFSLAATLLQWLLEQLALLSPALTTTHSLLGGLLLIVAGIYQFMPSKGACLRHCRSPVDFLSTHWRPGAKGAFNMGLQHGLYCLGCCWSLMLLLFVGGIMNLLWLAIISVFVLIEKNAASGRVIGRMGGVLFVFAGVLSIVL